jgi:sigma-B regulation protein RsbU (phosphoserine phosphatase)
VQLLLALAVAVTFAIFTQLLFGGFSPAELAESLVIVLVYSPCLGGLFTLATPLIEDRIGAARFPLDWVLFLTIFTLLTGLGCAMASFILYLLAVVPEPMDWQGLLFINRLVFGLTLLFGTFTFAYNRMKAKLGERNLELQEDLERESRQVQAREQELERAREIQEELLPKELPQIEGFSLAGAWQPASRVSGDYYDVVRLGDGALGLCIADVVGKGIGAALLMSNLQATVKAFATPETSPADLCGEINRVISGHVAKGKFITFFYGLLEPGVGSLRYCCAGHNPPVVVRSDGSVLRLETGGPVLGVFAAQSYEEDVIATAPGDRLLLFTDGVTEATSPDDEEFGDRRLVTLLQESRHLGAKRLTEQVLAAVAGFSSGRLGDDVTLLALSVD